MRKWWPLVAVCLGTFMLLVDVTIVNVALPQMADGLKTSFTALQWVIDAYALSLSVLLMSAGSLGDLLGHRRTYAFGLALFAVSSLVCGIAPNGTVLITARVIQGVGGAAMFTTTFALLNTSYRGRDRGTAFGVWGGVSGAAAAVGPILGGVLTQGISWRWIFFVNLPISVVAILLSLAVLPKDRERGDERFDWGGTVSFTVFATPLTLAVIRADSVGWGSVQTWGLLVLSALGLAAFVATQRRGANAMFDLALLRNRSFVGILAAGLLLNFAAFSALTFVSVWLQSVLGFGPIESGLTCLPVSVGAFVVAAAGGKYLHGRSPRLVIGGGLLLIGIGSLVNGFTVGATSSWPALMAGFSLIGVGVGLVMPILASAAMSAVPPRRGGMAAGAVNTVRQLGYALGIAVLGTLFAGRAQDYLSGHGAPDPAAAAHALAGGASGQLLASIPAQARAGADQTIHAAAASGIDACFIAAGIIGLIAGAVALAMIRRSPETHGGQSWEGQGGAQQPAGQNPRAAAAAAPAAADA
jgi:EmrB/QacA subfamily drug resistance transporter